jgi:hypothetical protein
MSGGDNGSESLPAGAFVPYRTTADRYETFARIEAHSSSPLYEELASGVSADGEMLAFLDTVPRPKRQPNLLFATVLYLGGVQSDYASFRRFVLGHADAVRNALLTRSTQTNEARRCAALLPLLVTLPGPLALIEVGASAGLCLQPDRYSYSYDGGPPIGDIGSPVHLTCETRGPVPIPRVVPEIVWRRGIDIAPIDVHDADAVRWLDCCIWPGQPERLERLRAAIGVAREDPPPLIEGDLVDMLPLVTAEAPTDATLVVFHSAVLAYLTPERRAQFVEVVATLPCIWISNEAPGTVATLPRTAGDRDDDRFVLGFGPSEVVGYTGPHGQWLEWSVGATSRPHT